MTYQQTVLIPLPRQHLRDIRTESRRDRRGDYRNRQSPEVNTILSFFE